MNYVQTDEATSQSKQDRSKHETEVDQRKRNSCRSFEYETQSAVNRQIQSDVADWPLRFKDVKKKKKKATKPCAQTASNQPVKL